ncbi:MAG: ParB/RepB/Spo0J family partition protein [Rhodospirillaceae bacterium]|nr:ParB/RepB/Spo0J family partition protein [Rhodospirillaceae bacterium]
MTPDDGGRRRNQLGRGLSALFGEDGADDAPAGEGGRHTLPIDRLVPNPAQPRRRFDEAEMDSLAASIREQGVLQPLLVRPLADDPGRYQIVAGERRWRAAQRAQCHEVPVVVRALSDGEALQIALIENVQRQDLSPIEEAEGYQRLIADFGHTQDALAQAVGKSRSHIANTVRLLSLPASVREMVASGTLSAGHARALLTCPDVVEAAQRVIDKGLNVRQTEDLARQLCAESRSPTRPPVSRPNGGQRDADVVAIEEEISSRLGLKVNIKSGRDQAGALTVHYRTLEQLDIVLQRLSQVPVGTG